MANPMTDAMIPPASPPRESGSDAPRRTLRQLLQPMIDRWRFDRSPSLELNEPEYVAGFEAAEQQCADELDAALVAILQPPDVASAVDHSQCHDLVCNCDTAKHPRGARGVGCSCRYRDRVAASAEAGSGEREPRIGYCRGSSSRWHGPVIEWQGCYTICCQCKGALRYGTVEEVERITGISRPSWWAPEKMIGYKPSAPQEQP